MVKLPKGCQEVKVENIEIVNVREPRPGLNKNIWGVDVSYKYKCPSCGKLDNSQKSEWFFEPQHKIYSSDTCNNSSCKKSYKAELTLKCDFSELKKNKSVKKESSNAEEEENEPEEEYNSSAKEEYTSSSSSGKRGFPEKMAELVSFSTADREGNIAFSISGFLITIVFSFFMVSPIVLGFFGVSLLMLIIYIIRTRSLFKSSDKKWYKTFVEDLTVGFAEFNRIINKF